MRNLNVHGAERGGWLAVEDARIDGMTNDRAHHHPHRGSLPDQRASTREAGVFGTTPRVSSAKRAATSAAHVAF